MKFNYRAIAKDGRIVQGTTEAKDASDVAVYLRSHEFVPIRITKQKIGNSLQQIPFLGKVGSSDIVFFTRQLSSMLASGLTLMESLRVLKEQIKKPAMNEIVSLTITDIEGGKSFSESIAKYPYAFSAIYISLIRSAEQAGILDKILLRLAENLEKQQKIRSLIKSALFYPAIVIFGMVVVVIIMMVFVIPQLSVVYESLNVELPLPTRIVILMSNAFIKFWPVVFGLLFLLIFLLRRWHKTESGRLIIDDLLLRLPVFGNLIKETILAEFARTFGLLIASGTLVVESLNQVADVAGNVLYKNAVLSIAKQIEKGVSIGDAFSGYAIFPPILVQMAKIGEETGKLDESLLRVSEYFEREVDETTKTLTTAMEPFIIVVLGLGVAFLIVSIITPIYNLTSAIK
ncbi:MAG: type II secretion system F family protein [Candidatus Levybacteria bacterium]|nr:type II secretion system F family protein [Candidatus Levybacteria bacterium]